jgi:tetratricopeptide (TPR) repeat protein
VIEGQTTDELAAWLRTAVTLSRAGDRTAAIAALTSAVGLAPDDLTAHRRLAAAHAIAGDRDRARAEYDRFIARLEARGALDAAAVERSYATVLLGGRPRAIAAPVRSGLTADQAFALWRVGVAAIAIAATVAAMLAAGAQIFASGGPL